MCKKSAGSLQITQKKKYIHNHSKYCFSYLVLEQCFLSLVFNTRLHHISTAEAVDEICK